MEAIKGIAAIVCGIGMVILAKFVGYSLWLAGLYATIRVWHWIFN